MSEALAELLPGFVSRTRGPRRSHNVLERDGLMIFKVDKIDNKTWRLQVIDYRPDRPISAEGGAARGMTDGLLCWNTDHGTKTDAKVWLDMIRGDLLYIDEEYIAERVISKPIESFKV